MKVTLGCDQLNETLRAVISNRTVCLETFYESLYGILSTYGNSCFFIRSGHF